MIVDEDNLIKEINSFGVDDSGNLEIDNTDGLGIELKNKEKSWKIDQKSIY